MADLYIYYDEKGPTDTIRITKNNEFNFLVSSDKLIEYYGFYLIIEDDNLNSINSAYKKLEESRKNEGGRELKSRSNLPRKKNIEKKGFGAFRHVHINFYNQLLDILIDNGYNYQLVVTNKAFSLISDILKPWIDWYEKNIGYIHVPLVEYTINKFLINEKESSSNFFEIIKQSQRKDIPVNVVLDELIVSFENFIKKYKKISKYKLAIENFEYIGRLFRNRPENEVLLGKVHEISSDDLYFGFDLLCEEAKLNYNDMIFCFDEESLDECFFKNKDKFKNVSEKNSITTVGIRISDMLVGLFGSLVDSFGIAVKADEHKKLNYLPQEFFEEIDNEQFYFIKKISKFLKLPNFIFNYFHSIYNDNLMSFISFMKVISTYKSYEEYERILRNNVKSLIEEHFKFFSSQFNDMEQKWMDSESYIRLLGATHKELYDKGYIRKY
ncbi:hypothetical protein [Companilactobacillus farciminis]|uniref:hypothetical protein n=1 Tax=Companilactobacillus farciminis TaxID=1612 RepID=UPI00233154B8|nr:hypothetical protein [Companilactobacillus farciminis]WCG34929.1 hypothetical protein PML84_08675 [Companilactobacillus farciminis]